jgi:hypothetical protein
MTFHTTGSLVVLTSANMPEQVGIEIEGVALQRVVSSARFPTQRSTSWLSSPTPSWMFYCRFEGKACLPFWFGKLRLVLTNQHHSLKKVQPVLEPLFYKVFQLPGVRGKLIHFASPDIHVCHNRLSSIKCNGNGC